MPDTQETATPIAPHGMTRHRHTLAGNPRPKKMPTGRPRKYTAEELSHWHNAICAWLMTGKSVLAFSKVKGNPTLLDVAVMRRESETFAHAYARAREDGADAWADEIVDIADSIKDSTDNAQVNAARLRVDARKWAASKLKPKTYADRIDQVLSDPDGKPLGSALGTSITDAHRMHVLEVLTTLKAIEGASNLIALLQPPETDAKTVDATVER